MTPTVHYLIPSRTVQRGSRYERRPAVRGCDATNGPTSVDAAEVTCTACRRNFGLDAVEATA